MSKIVIIGAGAMGSAFAFPCLDNNHDTNIVGTHLEDGFIDERTKKIQDSYYYQDYSYVVKSSSSISLDLLDGNKFSIISAESAGCSSFRVFVKNSVSLSLIFLLKILINSLLNSKFTFLSPISFDKVINVSFIINFKNT